MAMRGNGNKIELEPDERAKLREFLITQFSLSELRDLTFDLGFDYDKFPHSKNEFVVELIRFFERQGIINIFLEELLRQRPAEQLIQEILARSGASKQTFEELSADFLREPIDNPYIGYGGRPVMPPNFVGREDIIREIHKLWQGKGQLPPIILYGHRRMGKTSILKNLNPEKNPKIILVQVDMQDAGLVDNTGQLFYQFALEIYRKTKAAGLQVGANPNPDNFSTAGKARLELNELLELLDPQMEKRLLILAVDEFEIIQRRIQENKIEPDVLDYLRAINQRYDWLALIFAGLHELEEMGHDYRSAFYGSAKHLRVSYLDEKVARKLITQSGNKDFKLKYNPELVRVIYNLTYGQPYLVQMLCWSLVEQWNERLEFASNGIPSLLIVRDLDSILNTRFFDEADYYFDGVWGQINPIEHKILKVLAQWQEDNIPGNPTRSIDRLSTSFLYSIPQMEKYQLRTLIGLAEEDLDKSIKNLKRRDLVAETDSKLRFSSEITRRWVLRQAQRQREAAITTKS